MDDSASNGCAREMRGTWSMANDVTPRAASTSSSGRFAPGRSMQMTRVPRRSARASNSVGGRTLTTTSHASASAALPTLAPAAAYAASG